MILNKFNAVSFFHHLKAFSLQLLALGLFSCSKTANSHQNKAFIGVTHVAYGLGPVKITLSGISLFPVPLAFGQSSGIAGGNPYDTTTAGIQDLAVYQGTVSPPPFISGNAAFQQGNYY